MSRTLDSLPDSALPERRFRLAFFDIDSTLIGRSGEPSRALRSEISRIQSLGVQTAVASGRPYFAARPIIETLGLWAPGCFFTGGALIAPREDKLLARRPVPADQVAALVALARAAGIYVELYTLDDYWVEQLEPLSEVHAQYMGRLPRVGSLRALAAAEPIYKVMLVTHEQDQREALAGVMAQMPELTFATGYGARHPEIVFSSVVSAQACKRSAFAELTAMAGVDAAEVIAFGDGGSDKEFLRLAGAGVAMGNARQDVKACGDYVTRTVEEDGVAYALSRLVR